MSSRVVISLVGCLVLFFPSAKAGSVKPAPGKSRIVPFAWCPPKGDREAYRMSAPENQHQMVLLPGVQKGGKFPVVVAFHGQPRRGNDPGKYWFPKVALETAEAMVAEGGIKPFVLVLPVFRFRGENWPFFDTRAFRLEVEQRLGLLGITPTGWYALGHSGAAGCGGHGLNMAHAMSPEAVGFLDTCLGKGWQTALAKLRKRKIPAVNIHTVETAGFRPRQRPEYQSWFDFGRAYRPLGMEPISCPSRTPGEALRNQKYRCAASKDGILRGFVVDAGEGVEAHRAIVAIGLRYFLEEFLKATTSTKTH